MDVVQTNRPLSSGFGTRVAITCATGATLMTNPFEVLVKFYFKLLKETKSFLVAIEGKYTGPCFDINLSG